VKPDSRKIIHLGINFIIAPRPNLEAKQKLAFQQALSDCGLEYTATNTPTREKFIVTRQAGSPLEIHVGIPNPQYGQFLVIASRPQCTLQLFIGEAEAAAQAFMNTWPNNYQIISSDLSIRELHETTSEHAFKELWETRLHQPPEVLKVFNRPILGGGLRIVMPPIPSDQPPVQIEIKVESFLEDSSKIFVDLNCVFPAPEPAGSLFDINKRFTMANKYLEESVYPFIKGAIP